MTTHTTNYFDTFIQVADDCPANAGEVPPSKDEKKTIATIQFELVSQHPYQYSSDDVLFQGYALKNDLTDIELPEARQQFFSKGQPCLRSSPLTKRYGWGVHSNNEGKIAIFPMGSDEYKKLAEDGSIKQVKAMRSSRK